MASEMVELSLSSQGPPAQCPTNPADSQPAQFLLRHCSSSSSEGAQGRAAAADGVSSGGVGGGGGSHAQVGGSSSGDAEEQNTLLVSEQWQQVGTCSDSRGSLIVIKGSA